MMNVTATRVIRTIIKERGYTLSKYSGKTSVVIENIQIPEEAVLKDKKVDLYLGFSGRASSSHLLIRDLYAE